MKILWKMTLCALIFFQFGCATGVRVFPRTRFGLLDGERPPSLQWPLKKVHVTSHFGKRGSKRHHGIDLRAQPGTPVYAAAAGRVIYADHKIRGYGKMVVIRHDKGLATVYAHHSKNMVRRGQKVNQGQLIAHAGATGHAHGSHLHFEVRDRLLAVDPLKFLSPATRFAFREGPQVRTTILQ